MVYELEGLVRLCQQRNEIQDDILRLIKKKSSDINNFCEKLTKEDFSKDQKTSLFREDAPEKEYVLEKEYVIEDESLNNFPPLYSPSPINDDMIRSRGKLVFSINDKYRYRRELFDDSDVEFNNTLAIVASMDSFEEAEDYFLNEQGWDPENETVRDFLDKIRRYFR